MSKLTFEQIASALKEVPEWKVQGDALTQEFAFPDFNAALRFVNRVAEIAAAADHHPDIDIRYNRVRLSLTSHDSGGVTGRDVRLAKRISAI